MEYIEKIIDAAESELETMTKSGKFRSAGDVDMAYKLMDIIKDGYCIMEDYGGGEMSMAYEDGGMSNRRGGGRMGRRSNRSYAYDGSYDDGNASYARGRGRGARRYADGRYAPTSRDGGYSHDKEEFADRLRNMMEDAPDEQTRANIERMVNQMGG